MAGDWDDIWSNAAVQIVFPVEAFTATAPILGNPEPMKIVPPERSGDDWSAPEVVAVQIDAPSASRNSRSCPSPEGTATRPWATSGVERIGPPVERVHSSARSLSRKARTFPAVSATTRKPSAATGDPTTGA